MAHAKGPAGGGEGLIEGLGLRSLVPTPVAGVDLRMVALDRREGYVLSRVDGHTNLGDLCAIVAMPDTPQVLRRLVDLGLIRIPGVAPRPLPTGPSLSSPAGHAPTQAAASSPPGDAGAGPAAKPGPRATPASALAAAPKDRPSAAATPAGSPVSSLATAAPAGAKTTPASGPACPKPAPSVVDHQAVQERVQALLAGVDVDRALLEAPGIDLDPDRRRQILATHGALSRLSCYELLGVAGGATKADLKRAFFRLSKVFHPDQYFRRELGPYRPLIEAIFREISRAYEVLSDDSLRAQYDLSLTQGR